MTEIQKKWTEKKQQELEDYYNTHFPITDDDALVIDSWLDKTISQAKGEKDDCRAEVRSALFDVVEKWERKLIERRKIQKNVQ